MGFTQQEAATALGISRIQVTRLEKGQRYDADREGEPVEIDRKLGLAMAAVEAGLKVVR